MGSFLHSKKEKKDNFSDYVLKGLGLVVGSTFLG